MCVQLMISFVWKHYSVVGAEMLSRLCQTSLIVPKTRPFFSLSYFMRIVQSHRNGMSEEKYASWYCKYPIGRRIRLIINANQLHA